MIGLDTNVLLRYILQDDPLQSALATQLVESFTVTTPGFIPLICLTEAYWVLDHTYKLSRPLIANALEELLHIDSLLIEQASLVKQALSAYSNSSADFDDCLIMQSALAGGCDFIFTFDKVAAKSGVMQLLR